MSERGERAEKDIENIYMQALRYSRCCIVEYQLCNMVNFISSAEVL